jgi:hypothetical protein
LARGVRFAPFALRYRRRRAERFEPGDDSTVFGIQKHGGVQK